MNTTSSPSPVSRAKVPAASYTSEPKRLVVGAEHRHHVLRLGALGERREPVQRTGQHGDLAPVALQHRRVALDELGHLRRQERPQPAVERLDLVVVRLDPHSEPTRANSSACSKGCFRKSSAPASIACRFHAPAGGDHHHRRKPSPGSARIRRHTSLPSIRGIEDVEQHEVRAAAAPPAPRFRSPRRSRRYPRG